jgi:hypothetical protein
MPDYDRRNERAVAVIDNSESTRVGHFYEAARQIDPEILDYLLTWSGDGGRGETERIGAAGSRARLAKVLLIFPKPGTPRYRQWGEVLPRVYIAGSGYRELAERHVREAQENLTAAEARVASLAMQAREAGKLLEADRDREIAKAGAEEDEALSGIASDFEKAERTARGAAREGRQYGEVVIPAGALGTDERRVERYITKSPATPALLHEMDAVREVKARWDAANERKRRRLDELRRSWNVRIADTVESLAADMRAAERNRSTWEDRLTHAKNDQRERLYPGLRGWLRAFLVRELLESGGVANEELRKVPERAWNLAEATTRSRRLDEE